MRCISPSTIRTCFGGGCEDGGKPGPTAAKSMAHGDQEGSDAETLVLGADPYMTGDGCATPEQKSSSPPAAALDGVDNGHAATLASVPERKDAPTEEAKDMSKNMTCLAQEIQPEEANDVTTNNTPFEEAKDVTSKSQTSEVPFEEDQVMANDTTSDQQDAPHGAEVKPSGQGGRAVDDATIKNGEKDMGNSPKTAPPKSDLAPKKRKQRQTLERSCDKGGKNKAGKALVAKRGKAVPRSVQVHRDASKRWHEKWLSKGVLRPNPEGQSEKPAGKKPAGKSKPKGKGNHKTEKVKDSNSKVDLRTVKAKYVKKFLADYKPEQLESKVCKLRKAVKSWMESEERASYMSKPLK